MGHRPMYCSNNTFDCVMGALVLRHGIPFIALLSLKTFLEEFGVDVALTAHDHSYERRWPVFEARSEYSRQSVLHRRQCTRIIFILEFHF